MKTICHLELRIKDKGFIIEETMFSDSSFDRCWNKVLNYLTAQRPIVDDILITSWVESYDDNNR